VRYWLKIDISYPLHLTAKLGGPHRNTAITFGAEDIEWCGYQMVKKSFMICLPISTEY